MAEKKNTTNKQKTNAHRHKQRANTPNKPQCHNIFHLYTIALLLICILCKTYTTHKNHSVDKMQIDWGALSSEKRNDKQLLCTAVSTHCNARFLSQEPLPC